MVRKPGPQRVTVTSEGVPRHGNDKPQARTTIDGLCADVAQAVAGPLAERDRRVAAALRPYLESADLLPDPARQSSADRYARHLLHAGADFTILSLVWRPRQMSAIHAHQTWCAFGLHRAWLVETLFDRSPSGVRPRDCLQLHQGEVSHSPEDAAAVHRLANLGTETALSIHVYGAPFDRLGELVNTIWAD